MRSFNLLLFLIWLWAWPFSNADQTVFLERQADSLWEPHFNPKSISADVGEIITFEAIFSAQDRVQPLN